MTEAKQHLEALQDIKQMMERSSRFISLSGWSGIAAGVCALIGALVANSILHSDPATSTNGRYSNGAYVFDPLNQKLFLVAVLTFLSALVLAFLFTYQTSRKQNLSVWGTSARRLMLNVSIPMVVGGLFIFKLLEISAFGLIAPACLIFYGLALVHASKYTLGEIRYLGYGQIILGLLNCWAIGYGLYFWAAGFGILHIVYGSLMLWKYESK